MQIKAETIRRCVVAFLSRPRHYLRWALIHCALLFFFADLIAAIWPAFNAVWGGVARIGVALAAIFATCAEFFHEEGHDGK
jgi:hypothetical protein